jgi:hypothetical protein
MINVDEILGIGYVEKVWNDDVVWYEKKYNFYIGNRNIIKIREHTDKDYPQFLNSFHISLCLFDGTMLGILKTECRDITDIIAIDKCFTQINCKKVLKI